MNETTAIHTAAAEFEDARVALITTLNAERATLKAAAAEQSQIASDLGVERNALLVRHQFKQADDKLVLQNQARHEVSLLQQKIATMDRQLEDARQGRHPELARAVGRRMAAERGAIGDKIADAQQALNGACTDALRDAVAAMVACTSIANATGALLAAVGLNGK